MGHKDFSSSCVGCSSVADRSDCLSLVYSSPKLLLRLQFPEIAMKRCLILALGIFLLSSLAHAAPVTWTGGGGDGLWNTPKNWSNNKVPTSADDVTIGNFTVTANGDTDFANTVTCTGTFILNANMNISSAGSFTNLTLMAGTILQGTVTITGTLTMSGGNINTPGNVTISGLTMVTANGTLSSSGTVTNSGTINITGNGSGLTVGATFINNGTVNLQSEGPAAGLLGSGGGTINNNGTIAKTVGTGTSILQAGFLNNARSVTSQSGTLKVFGGNGAETGTFSADAGATLEFAPGNSSNLTLQSGALLTGAGTIHMTGGKLTLAADVTVSTANLVLDAGSSTVFGGSNNLNISSPSMIWNSASISGSGTSPLITISKNTTLQILTTGNHNLARNMDLQGTLQMSGDLALGGATVTVDQGATFNILTDNSITGQGTIKNGGTFEKTGGTNVSNLSFNGAFFTLTNPDQTLGTVTVSSGTLNFEIPGPSVFEGTLTASGAAATILQFSSGTYNLGVSRGGGVTFAGNGTTLLNDATWNVVADSSVTTPAFTFMATVGTIQGSANLTLKSPTVIWTGGNMAGSGSTTISKSVTVTLSGSPAVNGRTINNSGKINFVPASNFSLASCVWNNLHGSFFNFQADGSIVNGFGNASTFNNEGTVEKTGGTGISRISFDGTFNNNPGGKVVVGAASLYFDTSGTSGGGTKFAAFVVTKKDARIVFGLNNLPVWSFNSATTMSGAGDITLGQGLFNFNSDLTVTSAVWQVGILARIEGTGKLTVSSKQASCAGTLAIIVPGEVTISAGDVFSSIGSGCTFGGSTINVLGTLDATQGSYFLGVTNLNTESGADVKLGDTFGFLNGGAPTTWTNQGTMEKPSGTGTFTFNYNGTLVNEGLFNVGSGTVSIAPSIPTTFEQFAGGTLTVSPGATVTNGGTYQIDGGSLFGGNIFGSINNIGGNIQLPPGSMKLNAPLTQGSGSTTTETINGNTPGKFGQLVNSSSTVIGGQLVVTFGSGFSPSPTDTFPIETYSSASGNFSSVITPDSTCTPQVTVGGTAVNLQFVSNNVSVSINPTAVTLKVNTQQQFTDTVTNGCGNGVKWKVQEGAAGGKVTQKGLYTAPGTPGTFHVIVTSVADNTKSSTATVTVTAMNANKITVSPQAAVLQPGGTLHLQANTTVNWTVAEGVSAGSITSDGAFTASSTPGLYHVMASSTSDATEHTIVNIAVVSGKLKSAYVANLDKNSVSVLSSASSQGPATGQLQELESVLAGQAPAALAISPDGKYLAAANHDSNNVSMFAVANSDGALRAVPGPSMDTGTHPSAIAFDSAGHMAFVTNHDSDDISVFAVNSGQMTLLGKQALAAGDQPSAIAVHSAGSLLFTTNSGSNSVAGFTYDAAGMLSPISGSPFATGSHPSAAAIDPAGKFLFVANRESGDVSVFAIDAKNKTLQESAGSPFQSSKGAAAMAIDVTGSYLFVAGHESNDVTVFQIDGESGALMLVAHTPLQAAGPVSMAMDPSGQYLYVTTDKTGGVSTLKFDVSTGTLIPGTSTKGQGRASAIVVGSSAAAKQAQ